MNWKGELHDVLAMLFGPGLALRRGVIGLAHMITYPIGAEKPDDPLVTDVPVLAFTLVYPFDASRMTTVQQIFARLHVVGFALFGGYLYQHTIGAVVAAYSGIALVPVGYLIANWLFLATWDVVGSLYDIANAIRTGGEPTYA